jgi:hypothetical protein
MAITEDGSNLPKDAGNRRFAGGYNATGGLRAPRLSDNDYHTIVQQEKGTPVSSRVAIGATTTLLLAANATRRKATFANLDTSGTTVYLKPATGATTSDYPLPFGCEFTDDTGQTIWYAISATGSVNINVCEYS